MRMLKAAEFRALPAINTGTIRLDLELVLSSGNRILPVRLGTQNEWITSEDSSLISTGSPTGI
jgi:hypothetical protein